MIDWMFAIFLIVAFLFIILIIEYHDNPFWGAMFTILDIVLWFLLASSVLQIETPAYEYNATLGAMQPTLQNYTSTIAPELVYFFYMMGAVMMVFFIGYFMFVPVYELVTGKKWR